MRKRFTINISWNFRPIKLIKSEGTTYSRSTFELVGVLDNPIQRIKDYGKGVFECLNIISVE